MKAAHFLTRDRHGGYQFRRRIPQALRSYFQNRRELKKSLATYHRSTAIRSARRLAAFLDEVFDKLSKQLRDKYEKELFNAEDSLEFKERFFGAFLKVFDEATIAELERDGVSPGFQAIFDIAKGQIDELEELYDKHDLAKIKLEKLYALRKSTLIQQALGDLENELSLPIGSLDQRHAVEVTPNREYPREPISAYWEKYRAQKLADKEWKSPAIADGFHVMVRSFIEIVGDLSPAEITRQVCIAYADGLLDYPLRRFAGANAALSLDALRSRSPSRLSLTTRNGYLTAISTYFEWLIERELMADNWLTKAKLIPKRDERSEKREAFSTDDLKKIFSQDRFKGKYKRDWQYWIPLLGLFTGARIEELAQLRGIDVKQSESVQNVWFISISDRDDFTGKTENAVRVIPIHPKLIELGFIDFVRSIGKSYLFPEKPNSRGSRGHKVTSDFRRLIGPLKLGPKKVFHSFRYRYVNELSRAGVGESKIAALVGHAQNSVTFSRYWTANEQELNDAAMRINFDEVLQEVVPWKASAHTYS